MFDVMDYGAVGDGTTDDRLAIVAAVNACVAAGGEGVLLPLDHLVDSSIDVVLQASPLVTTPVGIAINAGNIKFKGRSKGLSRLRLGDGVNAQLLGFGSGANIEVSDLDIDGNASNQTGSWAGLYSFNNLPGFIARDLYIHNTSGYGIGLQHGTIVDANLQDILIEDTGSDGLDIKNNDITDRTNRMINVTVRRAGLNTSLSGQACIDLRGIWNLSNIIVEDFNNTTARCNTGIRFRTGPSGEELKGAQWSTLTNFYVRGGSRNDETSGITVSGYQVEIVGGQIQNCTNGTLFNGVESSMGDVTARDCDQGFYLDTDSNGTNLTGVTARNCSNGFYVKSDGCTIQSLQARGCSNGVNLQSTSQNTVLSGVATANSVNNLLVKSGATWKDAGLIY